MDLERRKPATVQTVAQTSHNEGIKNNTFSDYVEFTCFTQA